MNLPRFLLVICALLAALWATGAHAEGKRSDELASELRRRLAATAAEPSQPPTANLFRDLLTTEQGRAHAAAIAAERDDVEYHAARNAIYWAQHDEQQRKSTLSTIYVNDDEGTLQGHDGFPHQLQLRGLRLDEGRLVLRIDTRDDPASHAVLRDWGLEGGRSYEAVVDLVRSHRQQVRRDHVAEYRPIAR